MSSEASAKRGKWTCLPFQREPMDAALDPGVSTVVLEWASQTCGKTEVINNIIGYHVDRDPCPILLLQPTVEMGESWSKERFAPMVRDTPILRGKIRDARSRDSNNTILHKSFPGGHLSIAGTNAPAGLSMRPIKIVMCDEVDRYPASAGVEGDPVALALKRTESFPDAIKYMVGTPTIKGMSRIDNEFQGTDKRYFVVPCHACGHLQSLKWDRVKWPENKPEEARYHCENCNETWTDEQRIESILDPRAHWKATADFCGRVGFHLNGLYCLFRPQKGFQNRLHQFASEFLAANSKGANSLKAWINTFLAETWEEKGRDKDYQTLISRCRTYEILPPKALFWLGAADVQEDRIELEKRAFGMGEESWGLGYEILMGNTEFDHVWEALLLSIQQKFRHPHNGKELPAAWFFIDCAYRPANVLRFVKRCQNRGLPVYACLGSKSPWDEQLVSRPSKSVKAKATWFRIGTDHAKVTLFERLDVEEPGPRYMHFPIGRGYDEEYFKTLVAERLVLHYEDNILKKREWKKKRDRNEALDLNAYMIAAVKALNPAWDHLAKTLAVSPETPNSKANAENKQAAPTKPKSFVGSFLGYPKKAGFVKGWR